MPALGGLLLCERGASQLLGWREGFEQWSDNFSAEKFSELVPRPIGRTKCKDLLDLKYKD
jgi:hypothetical protein